VVEAFLARGWVRFGPDPRVRDWAAHARVAALAAVRDPAHAGWHVCDGTWFIGVDALPNDSRGRIGGSAPLCGPAVSFIEDHLGALPPLHPAQVSVIWPGYPRPREGEGAAAYRYRQRRDAAHLDGLKPIGPDRRRHIDERHAFILGLPLTDTDPGAAPLVVWEGSHEILRAALTDALKGHDPQDWGRVDLTEPYRAARARIFDSCRRVPLPARPGEAYLLHRLALHGVAPWEEDAEAGEEGRMIAYFRPLLSNDTTDWLKAP